MTQKLLKSYRSKISTLYAYIMSISAPSIQHVPKCMSYHESIGGLVITERIHCLFDYIISLCFYRI